MTTHENYIRRIRQGATVTPMETEINLLCDADENRRVPLLASIATIEDVIAAYLHEAHGIFPTVTQLIDPLDYYLYITTSPEEPAPLPV